MDYSKIQNGMESIIEALKESNSTSNGVDYNGISDMLHGQSDIIKNFLQGSYSSDTRSARETSLKALEERLILRIRNNEAPNDLVVAEATTDLIETITNLRDLIGATFDEETITSEGIADHLSNDLVIDSSDIEIDISASDVAEYIDPELIAEHIVSELENTKLDFSSSVDRLGVDLFKRLDELEGKTNSMLDETKGQLSYLQDQINYLPTESILKEYVGQVRRETTSIIEEQEGVLLGIEEKIDRLDDKLDSIESAIRNEMNEMNKASLQLSEKEVEVSLEPTELEELKDEINEGDEPLIQFIKALDHLGIMGTEAMYELRRMTVYLEELVEKKQKGERE